MGRALRFLYSRAEMVIVHSADVIDEAFELGANRVKYVPMGIRRPASGIRQLIEKRNRAQKFIRMKYSLSGESRIVTFVGRLAKEKGLDVLLAAAQHSSHKFFIVGDGPMKKNIAHHKNVIATGVLRGDELSRMYLASDLFVSMSTSETFGRTSMEALSHGTPILISPDGLHRSEFQPDDKAVFMYSVPGCNQSGDLLASVIDRTLRRPSTSTESSEAAYFYSEPHFWPNVINGHAELYRDITGR
jgi:glycosyltransferase involved in cell wall biosynthesis